MVESLEAALEKEGISATLFNPNHFATLSVYFARFLGTDRVRSRNGLRRWVDGLKKYIPGSAIEPEAERREHLASQCLPRHYDDNGVPQPVVEQRAGQAIASAPVTCELRHHGFVARLCAPSAPSKDGWKAATTSSCSRKP